MRSAFIFARYGNHLLGHVVGIRAAAAKQQAD